MPEEEGLVASTSRDGWAQVVTERGDACANCGASHCCASLGGSSKMVIKALNRANAGAGDLVAISIGSGALIQSAALFYVIPLVGLILGAVAGTTLAPRWSLGGSAAPVLLSFAGLGAGFLITALFTKRLSAREKFTPIITRVVKSGFQAPEPSVVLDPVCKMVVDPAGAPVSYVYDGKTYYFCHPGCREAFAREPEKYL